MIFGSSSKRRNRTSTTLNIVQLVVLLFSLCLSKVFCYDTKIRKQAKGNDINEDSGLDSVEDGSVGIYLQERLIGNLFMCDGKDCGNMRDKFAKVLIDKDDSEITEETIHELARGINKIALYKKEQTMYVFLTLIGDEPERIVLCSLDLTSSEKKLLPGPIIFSPVPMGEGPLYSLDFVPDDKEKKSELDGTLLYVFGNKQSIGAAKLKINLAEYEASVPYRNHSHIEGSIFQESSLAHQNNAPKRPLLITGVGRSGTTFVCRYLNQFGWRISHDNSKDCGPFPGKFGASSWYHAFQYDYDTEAFPAWYESLFGKRGKVGPLNVEKVVHLIRQPLPVIKSRVANFHPSLKHYSLYSKHENVNFAFEDIIHNDTRLESFVLRHWINRNSFVSKHAQWRIKIEDLTDDPLQTWMLCLEVRNAKNCPTIGEIEKVLFIQNTNTNHKARVSNYDEDDLVWWERMAELNLDDVRIALKMKQEYGYFTPTYLDDAFQFSSLKYTCGFLPLTENKSKVWGCSIIKDHKSKDIQSKNLIKMY